MQNEKKKVIFIENVFPGKVLGIIKKKLKKLIGEKVENLLSNALLKKPIKSIVFSNIALFHSKTHMFCKQWEELNHAGSIQLSCYVVIESTLWQPVFQMVLHQKCHEDEPVPCRKTNELSY